MERFEVAFSGQLLEGAEHGQVKANLAKLFQADEKRLAILFSGKRIVLKSGLDQAGADKYRTLMGRAGAVAEVVALVPEDDGIEEIELTALPGGPSFVQAAPTPTPTPTLTPTPTPTPTQSSAPAAVFASSQDTTPRDDYMKAFSHVKAPSYAIAPVGADLQEQKPEVAARPMDLSDFSLAPVGADMGELKRDQQAPVLDLSHLAVSE